MDYSDVFDLLSRVDGKFHIYRGRISGSLHTMHPSWTHVVFRGGKDETMADTLRRALKELHRRQLEGMPRTTQTAPCSACGVSTELRYLQAAKQWLCADCRRGLRSMSDERRRAKRPPIQDNGLSV
jgi:hypothetical protein